MLQSEPADNPAMCEQTDAKKAPIPRLEGNEQSGGSQEPGNIAGVLVGRRFSGRAITEFFGGVR